MLRVAQWLQDLLEVLLLPSHMQRVCLCLSNVRPGKSGSSPTMGGPSAHKDAGVHTFIEEMPHARPGETTAQEPLSRGAQGRLPTAAGAVEGPALT